MKNTVLFLLVILLMMAPLFLLKETIFIGTDTLGMAVISDLAPGYEPWFESLWKPPGTEVETFLFSLQAAIGSMGIGYLIGFYRAKKKYKTKQHGPRGV